MSPISRRQSGPAVFCVTMLSPGAAWQCALVRQPFGYQAHVFVLDRYQRSEHSIRRRFFCGNMPSDPITGLPVIDTASFRLRVSEDRRERYLSGSIEDKAGQSCLWDIRIDALHTAPDHHLFRAQGTLSLNGEEYLFPPVSSFLSADTLTSLGVSGFCGTGCILQPAAAFHLSSAADQSGYMLSGLQTEQLPPVDQIHFGHDGADLLFSAAVPAFHFRAEPKGPGRAFRFFIDKKHEAVTDFGLWESEGTSFPQPFPGFLISVI